MGNVDDRFGLRPVGHLFGIDWSQSIEKCYVSSSYGTALFLGDPVDIDTTLTDKDPTAKHQTIMTATAGDSNYIYGVIVGIEPNRNDLTKQYIPASTGGYAYVCVDPYTIFHIRDDGGTALTYVTPGQNGVIIKSHTGSTVTGLSGVELDTGTSDAPAADDSNQLYIRRLANIEDNTLAARAIWEVLINIHRLGRTSTSDGTDVGILGVTAT